MSVSQNEEWEAGTPTRPYMHRLAERFGELEILDAPAEAWAKTVRRLLGPGAVKDAISGTFLGHPLHPLLTDLPIGTWTSATLLDLIGGRGSRDAADRLVAAGIAAAIPTAITGTSDWADTTPADDTIRRIGAVHAVSNVAALALYGASLAARRRGRRGRGVLLGLAGMGALGVGGHLGGHLSYEKGVGVQQTVFGTCRRSGARPCPRTRYGRAPRHTPRRATSRSCSPATRAGYTRSRTAAPTAAGRSRTGSSRAAA